MLDSLFPFGLAGGAGQLDPGHDLLIKGDQLLLLVDLFLGEVVDGHCGQLSAVLDPQLIELILAINQVTHPGRIQRLLLLCYLRIYRRGQQVVGLGHAEHGVGLDDQRPRAILVCRDGGAHHGVTFLGGLGDGFLRGFLLLEGCGCRVLGGVLLGVIEVWPVAAASVGKVAEGLVYSRQSRQCPVSARDQLSALLRLRCPLGSAGVAAGAAVPLTDGPAKRGLTLCALRVVIDSGFYLPVDAVGQLGKWPLDRRRYVFTGAFQDLPEPVGTALGVGSARIPVAILRRNERDDFFP